MQRDTFAAAILKTCESHGLRIACAESLTAGLLADAFVRIPGASNVFLGSAVTYDIRAKASILGVDRALLAREGAVHPEVARQMAVLAARLYAQPEDGDTVIGLSTTGVAGPGPDGDKPAGLVYVGISLPRSAAVVAPDPGETWIGAETPIGTVRVDAVDGDGRRTIVVELRLDGTRQQVRERTVLRLLQNVSQFTSTF
ncbi:CinA family protein [Bifidobacterium platyrrhinorum]|uniref:Nicotinamide-nucleotide amidohydrolase family protein n=1 Tax=Bifidobacterium platyrrhinorum TaxID=2661628 RepID=A0A6L9SPS5_9BIFI|nr:nicotinamide-nucleotide amidohydrolase family protein [Bifidobacterium platyrrhinorum]NEG54454.1 nicotinamide-nucleotide amidohydrolase family protein [Bifidobacterium platyrrhinorum]